MDTPVPDAGTFRTYVSWFCASAVFGVIAFLIGAAFLPLYSDLILGGLVFVLAIVGGSMAIFFSSDRSNDH